MLKSSYKSSSTNSLYEFAEELTSFNKASSKQEKESNDIQEVNSNLLYSMEFPTNAYNHNYTSETYDIVD
ncbi:hypothetical protein [Sporomusa malonica]|nr:hypothetical protein [Sporomusa malonica]